MNVLYIETYRWYLFISLKFSFDCADCYLVLKQHILYKCNDLNVSVLLLIHVNRDLWYSLESAEGTQTLMVFRRFCGVCWCNRTHEFTVIWNDCPEASELKFSNFSTLITLQYMCSCSPPNTTAPFMRYTSSQ